jgi:hypothetical protein
VIATLALQRLLQAQQKQRNELDKQLHESVLMEQQQLESLREKEKGLQDDLDDLNDLSDGDGNDVEDEEDDKKGSTKFELNEGQPIAGENQTMEIDGTQKMVGAVGAVTEMVGAVGAVTALGHSHANIENSRTATETDQHQLPPGVGYIWMLPTEMVVACVSYLVDMNA